MDGCEGANSREQLEDSSLFDSVSGKILGLYVTPKFYHANDDQTSEHIKSRCQVGKAGVVGQAEQHEYVTG